MGLCTYVQYRQIPRNINTVPAFQGRLDQGLGEGWLRSSSHTSGSSLPRWESRVTSENWCCYASLSNTNRKRPIDFSGQGAIG